MSCSVGISVRDEFKACLESLWQLEIFLKALPNSLNFHSDFKKI